MVIPVCELICKAANIAFWKSGCKLLRVAGGKYLNKLIKTRLEEQLMAGHQGLPKFDYGAWTAIISRKVNLDSFGSPKLT